MSVISVLIVDDDRETQIKLKDRLEKSHFRRVFCVGSIDEMMSVLKTEEIDVVLLDNYLGSNLQGCNYISEIKKVNSDVEVIMITSDKRTELIIKSIKNGAFYYLNKDCFDDFELIALIKNAYDMKKAKEDRRVMADTYAAWEQRELKYDLVGNSRKILEIKSNLEKIARTTTISNVLIVGENGVGKNEFAKYYYSLLKKDDRFKPFFKIKCSSLTLENFRGLFYGNKSQKGMVEISERSIFLLEEIGDLPKDVQHLFIPLLKERFIVFDDGRKKENNLVFISTTTISIQTLKDSGVLSEDLYYALGALPFFVPPLRERKDDIHLLINYFTNKYSEKYSKTLLELPMSIVTLLLNYDWPGNITELQSVLEKMFLLGPDEGGYNCNELPGAILTKEFNIENKFNSKDRGDDLWNELVHGEQSYHEKMAMFRKVIIEASLERNNYIVSKVARDLRKNRSGLYKEFRELKVKGLELLKKEYQNETGLREKIIAD